MTPSSSRVVSDANVTVAVVWMLPVETKTFCLQFVFSCEFVTVGAEFSKTTRPSTSLARDCRAKGIDYISGQLVSREDSPLHCFSLLVFVCLTEIASAQDIEDCDTQLVVLPPSFLLSFPFLSFPFLSFPLLSFLLPPPPNSSPPKRATSGSTPNA